MYKIEARFDGCYRVVTFGDQVLFETRDTKELGEWVTKNPPVMQTLVFNAPGLYKD